MANNSNVGWPEDAATDGNADFGQVDPPAFGDPGSSYPTPDFGGNDFSPSTEPTTPVSPQLPKMGTLPEPDPTLLGAAADTPLAKEETTAQAVFPGAADWDDDADPHAADKVFPGNPLVDADDPALPGLQSAPLGWLLPSLICAIVAVVLAATLQFGSHTPTDSAWKTTSVAAWLLAGIVGISLLGKYFVEDTRRRAAGFYSVLGYKQALYWVTVVGLIVGVCWSAFEIAQWVGKL